jgi:hypothetical protein
MKKIISFFIAFIILQLAATAQGEAYTKKMQQTLLMFDSAKTVQDLQEVSATFERIGDVEKTQWLPYYYAALCQTNIGWMDTKTDKDQLAEHTLAIIAKADALSPNNSEVFCLKSMIATQQMLVDPQSRFMKYGAASTEALTKAKLADASNPRPYYLEGANIFNTPVAYGGGKERAKPIFEKAMALFNAAKPLPLYPSWGKKQTADMLAQCQ